MFSSSHFHKIYSLSVTEGSLSLSSLSSSAKGSKREIFLSQNSSSRTLFSSSPRNSFRFHHPSYSLFPTLFICCPSYKLQSSSLVMTYHVLDICFAISLQEENTFSSLSFSSHLSLSLFLSFPFPTIAHSLTLRFRLLQSLFSCHHLLDQRNPPSRAREVRRSTEIVSKCHSIPSPTCNGPFKQWNRSGSFG